MTILTNGDTVTVPTAGTACHITFTGNKGHLSRGFFQCAYCYAYRSCFYLRTSCFNQEQTALHPVWILRCTFMLLLCRNFLSHSGQPNGFSPVCVLRCTFKSQLCLNFLSQSGQTNGFSSMWILRCEFKWQLWTSCHNQDRRTVFHQCEFYDAHSIGHSLWTSCHNQDRRTVFHQCEFYDAHSIGHSLNFLSQSGQTNGFSPVWILRCTLKLLLCVKTLLQSRQANG